MAATPESLSAGPPLSCTIQQIYDGVQFFQRNGRVVVASPPNTAERVTRTIRSIPRADVFSVDFVERLLSPEVDKILGPAHIAYADPSTFRSSDPSGCRILTVEDAPIYAAFINTAAR